MILNNWMRKKISASLQYQQLAFKTINNLSITRREAKYVLLADGVWRVEFVSCSYLGLDQDTRLIQACSEGLLQHGVSFHAARTRMQPETYLLLDTLLGQVYCGSYPIVFPSVHMVHQAVLPLLGSGEMPHYPISRAGIVFILDRTVHASIQINRGLLQQFGTVTVVDYQDPHALEQAFQTAGQEKKTPIAIADSIGSMGGEVPIHQLVQLVEAYQGYIYLDDAHGTSVHGKKGCGYVLKSLNYILHPRLIFCASLGKGFGSIGGTLLLPYEDAMHFVKQFGWTYVFAGPPGLPLINAAVASAKIHLSGEVESLQAKLWHNVSYFDALMYGKKVLINAGTASPIRGVLIGDEHEAIRCADYIKQKGFLVTTALYPTVPKGKSMIRIAFSSAHVREQIASLSAVILSYFQR